MFIKIVRVLVETNIYTNDTYVDILKTAGEWEYVTEAEFNELLMDIHYLNDKEKKEVELNSRKWYLSYMLLTKPEERSPEDIISYKAIKEEVNKCYREEEIERQQQEIEMEKSIKYLEKKKKLTQKFADCLESLGLDKTEELMDKLNNYP